MNLCRCLLSCARHCPTLGSLNAWQLQMSGGRLMQRCWPKDRQSSLQSKLLLDVSTLVTSACQMPQDLLDGQMLHCTLVLLLSNAAQVPFEGI